MYLTCERLSSCRHHAILTYFTYSASVENVSCVSEEEVTGFGVFCWPATPGNSTFLECVFGPIQGVPEPGYATRECADGQWLTSNLVQCRSSATFQLQLLHGRIVNVS